MKECPNCKERLEDKAGVCVYCGWDFHLERVVQVSRDYALGRINKRYEYKLLRFECDDYSEIPIDMVEGELNYLSEYGWKLHSILPESINTVEIYKYVKEKDRGPYKREGDEFDRTFRTNRNVVLILERLLNPGESKEDKQ